MNKEDYDNLMGFNVTVPLLHVQPKNWRSLVYTSIMLAIKYWDDNVYWNCQIVDKLQIFDLKTTSRFENLFLELIDFQLKVENEVFDEYYKWLVIYKQFIAKSAPLGESMGN